MKRLYPLFLFLTLFAGGFALAGCDSGDGPAEEAGEAVDDAAEDAGEAMEDAGDEVEDATN